MTEINLQAAGIDLGDASAIRWVEIVALHVSEIDPMTASVTILQLEHESGRYLEIHDFDNSYPSALEDLASFLPLDQNWASIVRGLEPGNSLTVWKR